MNTTKLRSKRAIIATTAAVVVALGAGGAVWATAANADPSVQGADRDRVGNAATQAVGGGTVLDVETSDDAGEAYEVEVRKADGSEVDVALDKDLKVLTQAADDNDADDAGETPDRVLNDTERASAEKAALAAVGGTGGKVTQVEAGDAGEAAYEVEVLLADNTEWDVELDAAFKVIKKESDN
jgi:uncharacterized membrane protein YkoI